MNPESIISKAIEYDIFFGLLVFLVISIMVFFYRDRLKHDEEIKRRETLLEAKNEAMLAQHQKYNEQLIRIQLDFIQAMNNQTTAIKGVEAILQSVRDDVKSLRK